MILKEWEALPKELQLAEVKPYYELLKERKGSLVLKRVFDIIVSFCMLICLLPVFLVLAIAIKLDSPGPVFFRQERITQYGRVFRIFKFRTMVNNAEKLGAQVTTKNDMRITKVGSMIRSTRLDEIPQLINIFLGDMSYVGTRPEVKKYVDQYTPEMMATLLLPAGVTSTACIKYKDEAKLLDEANDVDKVYVEDVLPGKMAYNLRDMKEFTFMKEIKLMFETVFAVLEN